MTQQQFDKIIKEKTRRHQSEAFKYFWASLVLQIIVYSFLSHVIVKYWGDRVMVASLAGVLLYIPFTIVFMKKFKSMAVAQGSIQAYVSQQYDLLQNFYKFKKTYELILIPIMTLIGTFIMYQLYFPSKEVMLTLFVVTLVSCIIAIRAENKKSFDIPLSKLRGILEDLQSN